MPEEYDFDPSNSSLQIGIELEYPEFNPRSDEYLVSRGRPSNDLQREVSGLPSFLNGHATYDGTVGLEVVSNRLELADMQNWYAEVLEYMRAEYNAEYQPVGLMQGGSTAGTHIHISSISESKARELLEISQTPWAKVLFCSSIASDDQSTTWPVFRGGRYCQMSYGRNHYDCVNSRGNGHYEWRMPEPMVPEHVEILQKFLRLFEQSTDAAIEYAQDLLDSGDDRITAIQRAEKVGMDIDEMPAVRRMPAEADPENFYEMVANDWALPEIYTVEYDDRTFYVFETDFEGAFEVSGITFEGSDVMYADTLDVVDDNALIEEVYGAYQRAQTDDMRETEATKELKKIVKKKN